MSSSEYNIYLMLDSKITSLSLANAQTLPRTRFISHSMRTKCRLSFKISLYSLIHAVGNLWRQIPNVLAISCCWRNGGQCWRASRWWPSPRRRGNGVWLRDAAPSGSEEGGLLQGAPHPLYPVRGGCKPADLCSGHPGPWSRSVALLTVLLSTHQRICKDNLWTKNDCRLHRKSRK